MKRWLFNLLALLSLLVVLAAAVARESSHSWPMETWRPLNVDHGDWELIVGYDESGQGQPAGMRASAVAPEDTVGRWRALWLLHSEGRLQFGWQRIEVPMRGVLFVHDPAGVLIHDEEPSSSETWYSVQRTPATRAMVLGLGYEHFDWPTARAQPSNNPDAVPVLAVRGKATVISLPYWILIVFGLPLPALWLRARLREVRERRRRQQGLCPKCGYDVRNSGTQCPECGRAIEQG